MKDHARRASWAVVLVLALLAGTQTAQAEHWSSGVTTHATGPVELPGENSGVMQRMVNGTRRVLGAGVRVVYVGVTLPFKAGAAAVRSFKSNDETALADSRSRSSGSMASVLSDSDSSGQAKTVTEWMRQPRPE